MLRILMLKRGSAATLDNYRGAEGELVYDRTAGTLRIHDGIRTGGYTMQRNAVQMETPTIVSPSNGAVDVSRQITFTSTPYSGAGNHTASRWMIYLDAARTELLHDSGWSNDALNSYYFEAPPETGLYVQVMYRMDNELTTPWSGINYVRTASEWLTYFTAFSQTSHVTSYSRTTSWTLNTSGSASTSWSTSVSYSRGTSRTTSYSSSTLYSRVTSWSGATSWTTSEAHVNATNWTTTWSTYVDPTYPGGGYRSTGVSTGTITQWSMPKTTSVSTSYSRTTSYYASTSSGGTTTSWTTSWSGSRSTSRSTTKSWSTAISANTTDSSITYYETSFVTAVYTS